MFLRPEDRADLEDAFDPRAGDELFEQLWRLVHERLLPEVGDREQLRPALGPGSDDLRGVDLRRAKIPERLAGGPQHLRADLEDRLHVPLPGVECPVVQPGRKLGVDLPRGVQREFGVGAGDDLERLGGDLDTRRRTRLLLDCAGDPHHRLAAGV